MRHTDTTAPKAACRSWQPRSPHDKLCYMFSLPCRTWVSIWPKFRIENVLKLFHESQVHHKPRAQHAQGFCFVHHVDPFNSFMIVFQQHLHTFIMCMRTGRKQGCLFLSVCVRVRQCVSVCLCVRVRARSIMRAYEHVSYMKCVSIFV
jgi:hypothetical protein